MSIPGFTAEYSSAAAYQRVGLVRRRQPVDPRAGISPALTNTGHACWNLCRGGDAYPGCLDECNAALGGDGGGGGTGGGGGGTGGGVLGEHCGKCFTSGPHRGQQYCTVRGGGHYWRDC